MLYSVIIQNNLYPVSPLRLDKMVVNGHDFGFWYMVHMESKFIRLFRVNIQCH